MDGVSRDWHLGLPSEPDGMFESTSLELREEESEFLRDRICTCQPGSLLARLVASGHEQLAARYLWDAEVVRSMPAELLAEIEHARLFALCAWGGPLAYSLRLARMKSGSEELVGQLESALGEWQAAVGSDESGLQHWDRAAYWELVRRLNARISARTEEFAERWICIALRAAAGERVWDDEHVGGLIANRERQLKGEGARLLPENLRARDRWKGDPSGGPIDYRWDRTQIILNDILRGLAPDSGGGRSHA